MPITKEFFNELLPQGKYEVCLSSLVLEELGNTKDDNQRLKLLRFANELKAEVLVLSDEVEQIAK